MDIIMTNTKGEEYGYLDADSVDMEIGDTNDFEIQVGIDTYNPSIHSVGCLAICPGMEWGGKVMLRNPHGKTLTLKGPTWRGMLAQKVLSPPDGADYLYADGEAHEVIRNLMGDQFGSMFSVSDEISRYRIRSYRFSRYITFLDGITGMLKSVGAKMQISYQQGPPNGVGYVQLSAVPIIDYSSRIEINGDDGMQFNVTENRGGINHLICLGSGELKYRQVVHLYASPGGQVGTTQYYKGENERVAVYDYPNAEDDLTLIADGKKRLRELMDSKECSASVTTDIQMEIGDIIGGRERITNTAVKVPVVRKILKIQDGTESIEYKLKGEA